MSMGGLGSGGKPRIYPPELVAAVVAAYEAGATILELAPRFRGVKVQLVLDRAGIPKRPAIPRDQTGPKNPAWKGDAASRGALWLRRKKAGGS